MPRVIHFEIHAGDLSRAVEFYEGVFGWKISKWGGPAGYWLATTGDEKEPGINGAIMQRTGNGSTWNTISVPDIDEFIKKVTEAGGKVTTPKMAVPGVGYMAYCEDTEGNTFGIMQMDEKAK